MSVDMVNTVDFKTARSCSAFVESGIIGSGWWLMFVSGGLEIEVVIEQGKK
jgi:hypothetical protein